MPPNPSGRKRPHHSYQLLIRLDRECEIRVGALGRFRFPEGWYLYTGSARRNLEARLQRHLRREKRLRWHIDYLLAAPAARVLALSTSARGECAWNRASGGRVIVPGFGAGDCTAGCGAHLRLLREDAARRRLARFHRVVA